MIIFASLLITDRHSGIGRRSKPHQKSVSFCPDYGISSILVAFGKSWTPLTSAFYQTVNIALAVDVAPIPSQQLREVSETRWYCC
mmetsp:Transcript_58653/g.124473  ORF Transcript_58653/g.124473 Transcript_58653/m.124473 type:complete len:85 (-) Transcript_58653:607-861(-)